MFNYLFTVAISMFTYFVTRKYDKKRLAQIQRNNAQALDDCFLHTYSQAYHEGFERGVHVEQLTQTYRAKNAQG